jgi:peptidoglycan/xylan/chitin deacetylase (PgdA/CDA1 family)
MPMARVLLWFVSVSALVWCALSLHHPLPSALELSLAFVGLFLYATLGVLWPHCGMYGDALWRGKAGSRRVALTFDDGPHPVTTRAVLQILREHDVRATFFLLGHKVLAHPEVVREIHAAGHTLGVHGFQHDRLFCLRSSRYAVAQIERTQRAIADACGVTPTLFRPPIGFASHLTFRGAERAGVEVVAWTVRSLDGLESARAERVTERVVDRLVDGAIVLLHDAAERDDFEPASIAALPNILKAVRDRQYQAVGVDQLPR